MAGPNPTAYQQNTYNNGFDNINLEANRAAGNYNNTVNNPTPLARGYAFMSAPFKNPKITNGIGAAAFATTAVLGLYIMNHTHSTALKICFGTLAGSSLVCSQAFTSKMMS